MRPALFFHFLTASLFLSSLSSSLSLSFNLSEGLPAMPPWLLLQRYGALCTSRWMLGRILLPGGCGPPRPSFGRQPRRTVSKRWLENLDICNSFFRNITEKDVWRESIKINKIHQHNWDNVIRYLLFRKEMLTATFTLNVIVGTTKEKGN